MKSLKELKEKCREVIDPMKDLNISLDEKDVEESLLQLKKRVGPPQIHFKRRL